MALAERDSKLIVRSRFFAAAAAAHKLDVPTLLARNKRKEQLNLQPIEGRAAKRMRTHALQDRSAVLRSSAAPPARAASMAVKNPPALSISPPLQAPPPPAHSTSTPSALTAPSAPPAPSALTALRHPSWIATTAKDASVLQAVKAAIETLPADADHLVFDTETTGLAAYDVVVQCAWVLYNANGVVLRRYCRYWKMPPGQRMQFSAWQIHKINENRLLQPDVRHPVAELLMFLGIVGAMERARLRVVAHNANFDVKLINQTCKRWNVDAFLRKEAVFCTMIGAKPHCGRVPSNVVLYEKLTGKKPPGNLHDALVDVGVTSESYRRGRLRRWWN